MNKYTLTSIRLVLVALVSIIIFVSMLMGMSDKGPISIIIIAGVSMAIGSLFRPSAQDIEELKIWIEESRK